MKKIIDLEYSFPDAENYRRREFKEIFNRNFVADDYISEILKPETSFLIGEKGAGKTAYAVYLTNNKLQSCICDLKFIRETEYQKFVSLKQEKQLDLSDYTNIWKVIILLMLAKQVANKEKSILPKSIKFRDLNSAIDEYYVNAFSPEILYALQFVQESKIAAECLSKFANASGEQKESITFVENRFQTNLFYIQNKFEKAFSDIKLTNSHILFIDGIDIRPDGIEYSEYLGCVKGLANAVWQLNNDFFPSIKDSKGRLKAVLLIRPDIFTSLGLQNQNTKIRTNSVYLDWRTTYKNYETSSLFRMIDKLLFNQQSDSSKETLKNIGDSWRFYFPYTTMRNDTIGESDSSFIGFLRYSFYRPRDILMMLEFLKDIAIEKNQTNKANHVLEDFESYEFKRKLSDHLFGEIKDQISFYYTSDDYEFFLKFFDLLNGSIRFTYDEYLVSHSKLIHYIKSTGKKIPNFMDTPTNFLQFLYETNVICYVEDVMDHKPFIRWSFRERNYSNLYPKVKEGLRYEIFYGLSRAVHSGKKRIKQS